MGTPGVGATCCGQLWAGRSLGKWVLCWLQRSWDRASTKKRSCSALCHCTLAQEKLPGEHGLACSWQRWLCPVAGVCGIDLAGRSLCGHGHPPCLAGARHHPCPSPQEGCWLATPGRGVAGRSCCHSLSPAQLGVTTAPSCPTLPAQPWRRRDGAVPTGLQPGVGVAQSPGQCWLLVVPRDVVGGCFTETQLSSAHCWGCCGLAAPHPSDALCPPMPWMLCACHLVPAISGWAERTVKSCPPGQGCSSAHVIPFPLRLTSLFPG